MLTPRRGAMVWPGTSSARDLGTISWRMNAVCEPLDHDSCQPSEDQWRKRNKDLGCFKPMGEKQDNQLSWGTPNSGRSDRPLEERRPISGGEYNFEEHKYHRTPDDGRRAVYLRLITHNIQEVPAHRHRSVTRLCIDIRLTPGYPW